MSSFGPPHTTWKYFDASRIDRRNLISFFLFERECYSNFVLKLIEGHFQDLKEIFFFMVGVLPTAKISQLW